MRILVVEDEQIVARRLVGMLQRLLRDRMHSIRHIEDVYDGLEYIRQHPIDLLFLDLNLNGTNGFRMLMEAVSQSFQTVIVSAHSDQALRAFEYGVTDFVAKPYTEERLKKALDRVTEGSSAGPGRLKFVAVREKSEVRAIPLDDILFFQGADDYCEVHCRDGGTALYHKSLRQLAHLLPPNFALIHRSYLVNLRFATGYEWHGKQYRVVMQNELRLPISRRKVQDVKKYFAA